MVEYTKGEWEAVGKKPIAYSGYHIEDTTQGTLSKEVAIVYPHPQGKSEEWGEANARLIASAPDLYEALTEALEELLTCEQEAQTEQQQSRIESTHHIIEQALAKAEGK